nr:hypothetical protein [Tanacetum cinerariifolium]
YEIQSIFASITSYDQGFTVDRNMDDFLVTENFGMILGQPVHTDDKVKTIEFNRHEINFERHDKRLSLVADYFQWLAFCFGSSWLNGPPFCKIGFGSFLSLVLLWLVVIVVVVGIGVMVVVFVESSSVVKLSFVSDGKIHLLSSGSHSEDSTFYQKFLEFNPGASLSSEFLLALSAFAMVAACVSRAVATLSTTSCLMAA